jgi:ketosteroid isomerase-like protein
MPSSDTVTVPIQVRALRSSRPATYSDSKSVAVSAGKAWSTIACALTTARRRPSISESTATTTPHLEQMLVRRWMAATYREPPKFQVHRMVAEGDFVAALGKMTLKNEAGTPVRHAFCDVWRFDGGRIAGLHAYVVETGAPSS